MSVDDRSEKGWRRVYKQMTNDINGRQKWTRKKTGKMCLSEMVYLKLICV